MKKTYTRKMAEAHYGEAWYDDETQLIVANCFISPGTMDGKSKRVEQFWILKEDKMARVETDEYKTFTEGLKKL